MELSKYEIEVLNLMLKFKFKQNKIDAILNSPITGYEFTGGGYFLVLSNKLFPIQRKVISEPILIGRGNGYHVGFILFIEQKKLIFECHSWGNENPPSTIRNEAIEIIASKEKLQ